MVSTSRKDNQGRKLYVGTHDGICAITSSDGGRTWEQGPVTQLDHAASRISPSRTEHGRAYVAAYESGVYRTDDGGGTWKHVSSYPCDYAHSVLAHPDDPGVVYAGGEPAAVFRSSDGGDRWEECTGFQAVPESSKWFFHSETRKSHVRDLRAAPGDPTRMYAGIEVGGIVRSTDGGRSWQQLPGTDDDIHFINLSQARPDRVYAATAAGPYRSDDGGTYWIPIKTGLERRYSVQISAAPDDSDVVLVAVSSNAGRQNAQFYRSTSAGKDWHRIDSVGADDDMVIAIDWDTDDPRQVYAGTDKGRIYQSSDGGESWEQLSLRVPNIAVGALVVAPV